MDQVHPFDSFGLNQSILKCVTKAGFERPTPIQAEAIPHVMAGKDLLALAQTGTGKTAAFALPLIDKLVQEQGSGKGVRVLVLVPTRELADQVCETFRTFAAGTKLRAITLYGGVPFGSQLRELRFHPEIVVACPGRLVDHVERRTIDLSSVKYLVLDEADRMFDMGFLPKVKRIVKLVGRREQSLLFSATMPSELSGFAFDILKDPVTVKINADRAAPTVRHAIYMVTAAEKLRLLEHLLKTIDTQSVLVFTRTKHQAKKVARELSHGGFSAIGLQGNLSQGQRTRAMQGFRDGRYQILVATDIAARGIDISSVSHVINFDAPDTVEAYVHRVGRTGRAEKEGDAFTLATPADNGLIRAIERRLKATIERRTLEGFVPGAQRPRSDSAGGREDRSERRGDRQEPRRDQDGWRERSARRGGNTDNRGNREGRRGNGFARRDREGSQRPHAEARSNSGGWRGHRLDRGPESREQDQQASQPRAERSEPRFDRDRAPRSETFGNRGPSGGKSFRRGGRPGGGAPNKFRRFGGRRKSGAPKQTASYSEPQ